MRTLERTSSAPSRASSPDGAQGRRRHLRRPSVNIAPLERAGRILVGAIGVVGGALLLAATAGALATILEVLLVATGVDLVVTGALGHCPLYAKLGHVPRSLRRTS